MPNLREFLVGSDPKFSTEQKFSPQDTLDVFNLFRGEMGGLLQLLTQGAFSGASSFGPGFQGGIGTSVANAQNAGLMQMLGMALRQNESGIESFMDQGSGGLLQHLAMPLAQQGVRSVVPLAAGMFTGGAGAGAMGGFTGLAAGAGASNTNNPGSSMFSTPR